MPRKPPAPPAPSKLPRGNIETRGGVYALRIRLAGERKRIPLGAVADMSEARAREKADAWLERMEREGYGVDKPPPSPGVVTVKMHFEAWTSGELYRQHGPVNGLKIKASADSDRWRAAKWIEPLLGHLAVTAVTEQDIERVIAKIPDERAGTRLQVYGLLHRAFDLAVRPARLRADNPVTEYQRPPSPARKLFAYVFPAELLSVLACLDVPIGRRVLYALAVYTGLRKSSLFALTWDRLDVKNGTILSTVSKTGIAQMFEIPAGLLWVLRRWRVVLGARAASSPIVPRASLDLPVGRNGEAEALRDDLRAAGVDRAALYHRAKNVEPLRFHDLRATFVTWAKRDGKGDGWISDRTGHLTPEMIERYSRAARTLADLKIEPFPDLTGKIPELVKVKIDGGPDGDGGPEDGATAARGATAAGSCDATATAARRDGATREDGDGGPPAHGLDGDGGRGGAEDGATVAGSSGASADGGPGARTVDPHGGPSHTYASPTVGIAARNPRGMQRFATVGGALWFQVSRVQAPLLTPSFRWGRKRPQTPARCAPLFSEIEPRNAAFSLADSSRGFVVSGRAVARHA